MRYEVLGFDESTSPSDSSAKSGDDDILSFFELFLIEGMVDGEGNGSGGSVGVFVDGDDDIFLRNSDGGGHRGDDSEVGLVGDEDVYILDVDLVFVDEGGDSFSHE